MNLKIDPMRKVSLSEVLQQQAQDNDQGLDPLPLDPELLLNRIRAGGVFAQYLGDAFISAYRMTPFRHSLGVLVHLDAEGFKLFHQILHIRHTVGWSDNELHSLEQVIKSITRSNA